MKEVEMHMMIYLIRYLIKRISLRNKIRENKRELGELTSKNTKTD